MDRIRGALETIDDAITFADLPPGLGRAAPTGIPDSLTAVLDITNGPRCGSIVLFDGDSIDENQFFAQDLEGGPERWICYGTCDYVPLFADRRSEEVYWSPEEDDTLHRLADDVPSFFRAYAIGPRYGELTPADDDRWYEFLTSRGLVFQGGEE
ncbi:hypothetical protein [Actinoallomurus oryzae]|uniref:hypothetical protein n=1 Tax=Actinoallomurus oryzae TaxID=502180 RepID=UPI0031EEECE8